MPVLLYCFLFFFFFFFFFFFYSKMFLNLRFLEVSLAILPLSKSDFLEEFYIINSDILIQTRFLL